VILAQNIARAIFAILEECKIASKLTGITTAGASNNIKMMTGTGQSISKLSN
jgi:hypothetical protein